MKLAAILLLVGAAHLGYASSLTPYLDGSLFHERYMALSVGQSTEYSKLRDEMLTPKYQLQDCGGTLVALSIGVFFVSRRGWSQLKSPKSHAKLSWLAIVTPFLTVGGYIFDLLQAYARGEFPHWEDSTAIPLMGAPFLLLLFLVWSGAHLAFLPRSYQATLLYRALSRKGNGWLLGVAAITALLVAQSAAFGQYWYAVPGVLWLYFYMSLAASRRATPHVEVSGYIER